MGKRTYQHFLVKSRVKSISTKIFSHGLVLFVSNSFSFLQLSTFFVDIYLSYNSLLSFIKVFLFEASGVLCSDEKSGCQMSKF